MSPLTPETTSHLTGRLVPRASITAPQRRQMLRLLDDHFENVSLDIFEADLAEKDWAVLLEDPSHTLRGFSTFTMHRSTAPSGEEIAVVFSGDTIVHRDAWGTPALPRAWIHGVYQVHQTHFAGLPLWWLLITSGFRTYRFLPVFWREFWPRFDAPEAPPLLKSLAIDRFGRAYDVASNIVRLPHPQRLRGSLKDIPAEKLDDPHVAFFARANPGYIHGDELACLASLSPANLTPAGRRMVYGPGQRSA